MASKQTRRSISVSHDVYERLKAWCDANHDSMSNVVEVQTRKFLGMEPRSTTADKQSASTDRKTSTEVRVKTSELSEKSTWVPAIELPARVDTIKEVAEARKVLTPDQEKAAKIFTF